MKTIFFFCIVLCWYSTVYAQDSLKANQGKFTTELNVNPFQGELSLNNSINQLKFRYFTKNNFAFRVGLNADFINNNSEVEDVYGTKPIDTKFRQKSTTIGLNLGFEKHLKGSKRLSPYFGADVVYINKSSSQFRSELNSSGEIDETTIEGAWLEEITYINEFGYRITETEAGEAGYSKYGLTLLGGFDFYIAENFYFGYEFTFGFSKLSYKDINIKTSFTDEELTPYDQNVTEFSVGASLLNGIRLGFVF